MTLPIPRSLGSLLALVAVFPAVTCAFGQSAATQPAGLFNPRIGSPAAPVSEADKNPHVLQTRTSTVAVFKNGLGFFMRRGDVALRDGWCLAESVPPAAYGSLAIFAQDKDQVVDTIGSGPGEVIDFDGVDAPKDPTVKRARLEASKNLNVQITYEYKGENRVAIGRVVSTSADSVGLETGGLVSAVPIASIVQMQVLELPIRIHVLGADKQPASKATIGIAYLRKGITWVPEYTLKVLDDSTAELSLRGTLINEAEDLIHTDVNFVVGVPNFVHSEKLAPLAGEQVVRTLTMDFGGNNSNSGMFGGGTTVAQQGTGPGTGVTEKTVGGQGGDLTALLGNLPTLEGAAGSDFTVYAKKDLTIRSGEKAILTLMVKKVKYTDIYRWTPPAALQHFLSVTNDTDSAFTTGPVLVLSGERPLTEDVLRYTPIGGKAEIPVTTAVNISTSKTEAETNRKIHDLKIADNNYLDLVTIEGTIKLANFERRPVDLMVVNPVAGKPLAASDQGTLATDSDKLKLRERSGSIRWQIKLEPGKAQTLTYSYEAYAESN